MINLKQIYNKILEFKKYNFEEIYFDILTIGSIAISNAYEKNNELYEKRENQYKHIIKKYEKNEQQKIIEIFTDIYNYLTYKFNTKNFNDYLGNLYMFSKTSSNSKGQYFTPYEVSKTSGSIVLNKTGELKEKIGKNNDYIYTIYENCCGSGGMIIGVIEQLQKQNINTSYNVCVKCGDIDWICCYMTYLQLTLAGVPAIVIKKDGLSKNYTEENMLYTPAFSINFLHFSKIIDLKIENKENTTKYGQLSLF